MSDARGFSRAWGTIESELFPCGEYGKSIKNGNVVSDQNSADALGMTEGELYGYLDDLLHEEAAEAAAESGKSVDEELETTGFLSAEAANTYAIKLILANNAFITRQLLDLGLLNQGDGEVIEEAI